MNISAEDIREISDLAIHHARVNGYCGEFSRLFKGILGVELVDADGFRCNLTRTNLHGKQEWKSDLDEFSLDQRKAENDSDIWCDECLMWHTYVFYQKANRLEDE